MYGDANEMGWTALPQAIQFASCASLVFTPRRSITFTSRSPKGNTRLHAPCVDPCGNFTTAPPVVPRHHSGTQHRTYVLLQGHVPSGHSASSGNDIPKTLHACPRSRMLNRFGSPLSISYQIPPTPCQTQGVFMFATSCYPLSSLGLIQPHATHQHVTSVANSGWWRGRS